MHGCIIIIINSIKIMKKTTTLFLGMLFGLNLLFAQSVRVVDKNQNEKRKGFIGLSIGPSIPLGEFKDEGLANTGLNITLVNFGYMLSDNFGIAGSWYGGAHTIDASSFGVSDGMWSYGGLMAGPLFSTPLNDKIDFDIKALIGYSIANLELEGYKVEGKGLAYDIGAGLRFNFSPKWAFLLNVDHLGSPSKGEDRKSVV